MGGKKIIRIRILNFEQEIELDHKKWHSREREEKSPHSFPSSGAAAHWLHSISLLREHAHA